MTTLNCIEREIVRLDDEVANDEQWRAAPLSLIEAHVNGKILCKLIREVIQIRRRLLMGGMFPRDFPPLECHPVVRRFIGREIGAPRLLGFDLVDDEDASQSWVGGDVFREVPR